MNTFKEAGTGLFSLFDTVDSLDVFQNRSVVRAQIVTELKDYDGPIHEFLTPETSLPDELYPVRKYQQCKVRILDPNMAHEKLLDPWGDGATVADPAKNKLFESLLPTMIVPGQDDFDGLQKKDIVFVRLRPGDNNMTYSLQYCDYESIDVKWASPPSCNALCEISTAQRFESGIIEGLFPLETKLPTPGLATTEEILACAARYDETPRSKPFKAWSTTAGFAGGVFSAATQDYGSTDDQAGGQTLIWGGGGNSAMPDNDSTIATLNPSLQPYVKCLIYESYLQGYGLNLNSSYRSYAEQLDLYNLWNGAPNSFTNKTVTQNQSGIATAPADPGSSFHNWGLAVDFNPVENMGINRVGLQPSTLSSGTAQDTPTSPCGGRIAAKAIWAATPPIMIATNNLGLDWGGYFNCPDNVHLTARAIINGVEVTPTTKNLPAHLDEMKLIKEAQEAHVQALGAQQIQIACEAAMPACFDLAAAPTFEYEEANQVDLTDFFATGERKRDTLLLLQRLGKAQW